MATIFDIKRSMSRGIIIERVQSVRVFAPVKSVSTVERLLLETMPAMVEWEVLPLRRPMKKEMYEINSKF